ncbi:MAG TPA: Ig-like domain-containing protein [Solirubrobacter sp.]
MKRLVMSGTLLALLVPASADAATLTNRGGTLVYTGTDAHTDITFTGGPNVVVTRTPPSVLGLALRAGVTARAATSLSPQGDADPITADGCTGPERVDGPQRFTCPSVAAITVDAGGGDDEVSTSALAVPITSAGGAGDDSLAGGAGSDALDGGPGNDVLAGPGGGADRLSGGAGEDQLLGGRGDTFSGGTGIDTAFYAAEPLDAPATISLDGVADDGEAGAAANVLPDVEDVTGRVAPSTPAAFFGPLTLRGSAAANQLTGGPYGDAITGGLGADTLMGRAGDDVINARDGVADRVSCGAGNDTAIVDPLDDVGDGCETVDVAAAGYGLEDTPPTIAFKTPKDAARLKPGAAITLEVDAGDAFGVQSVRFADDAHTLCTVSTPPFTCAYQPRPQDVGRNLLVAVVTDTAGQTATATRPVTVSRYEPAGVSLRARRAGHRWVVTGKVSLPKGPRCAGSVTVAAGRARRTVTLARDCTYRATLVVAGARPRFVATYEGSDLVASRRSAAR